MKMINHNIMVKIEEQKDPLTKVGSIFIPTTEAMLDYVIGEVVSPDKDGEFKVGDRLAFDGSGIPYEDNLIIKKHQILFIDEL